ncbi:hypothetical protein TELCIR_12069 [Teladorsagia circumcincta]|uniref:Uncharacterized protein n=1 Tax=Teladorsagia circumcincta TaxID=45464 RepID=A0A2G9U7S1_TELCI|nr:hypothetical protein TELCIR_12069 [Teladorsagia circumcincta]
MKDDPTDYADTTRHLQPIPPDTPTLSCCFAKSKLSREQNEYPFRIQSFKVTSMHEKTGPGKLTDFVPESERAAAKTKEEEKKEFSYRRASDEEPRLIRNYDLPPATPTTTRVTPIPVTSSPYSGPRRVVTESESVSAVPKRSTLPRDTHVHEEGRHLEDDTVAGRSYLGESSAAPDFVTLRAVALSPPMDVPTSYEFGFRSYFFLK